MRTAGLLAIIGAGALATIAAKRAATRFRPQKSPELPSVATLDRMFHGRYDEARSTTTLDAPVFVVLADVLVVHHLDERRELAFGSAVVDALKVSAHAPVALFATLHGCNEGELPEPALARLKALRASLAESLDGLSNPAPDSGFTSEGFDAARAALSRSLDFADATIQSGRFSRRALTRFARGTKPSILHLTAEATRLQLTLLDAAVESALTLFTAAQRRKLHVIVTGSHQGRARSLALQYFEKRLREPAEDEARVAYAEGVSDEKGALALVGTRKIDFAVAKAFFGDERRLQRDVLGDAAEALLAKSKLRPIGSKRQARGARKQR